ncbi:hypothetical protein Desdi_3374 [Desulfitobacterium dichloroeliminans LMG P-21439]|uniref:Uncharacterized protein n=1 Tax=Desulfitobacterium dichloroeliminans (strain LMG P-21439 / DCA1) TaxID=871963 RepID=L0FCM9_DESDL|nr:hypothetical protein [Desulfitobacterium dichloroeliminans]AGA70765.1 hypothetical protein Desdi_3374 [Desulfitobacterium dichloroeliminans LMG P-21439]
MKIEPQIGLDNLEQFVVFYQDCGQVLLSDPSKEQPQMLWDEKIL